jgi:hypothetical protein
VRTTFPLALAAGVIAALVTAQPALAYARTSGTGNRSDHVVAGQALTVTGPTATFTSSAKANDKIAVTATVTNHDSFHRWVRTVSATFASSDKNNCGAADYSITGSPVQVNRSVAGQSTLQVTGIQVVLVTGGCKGSTVTLNYAVG